MKMQKKAQRFSLAPGCETCELANETHYEPEFLFQLLNGFRETIIVYSHGPNGVPMRSFKRRVRRKGEKVIDSF